MMPGKKRPAKQSSKVAAEREVSATKRTAASDIASSVAGARAAIVAAEHAREYLAKNYISELTVFGAINDAFQATGQKMFHDKRTGQIVCSAPYPDHHIRLQAADRAMALLQMLPRTQHDIHITGGIDIYDALRAARERALVDVRIDVHGDTVAAVQVTQVAQVDSGQVDSGQNDVAVAVSVDQSPAPTPAPALTPTLSIDPSRIKLVHDAIARRMRLPDKPQGQAPSQSQPLLDAEVD